MPVTLHIAPLRPSRRPSSASLCAAAPPLSAQQRARRPGPSFGMREGRILSRRSRPAFGGEPFLSAPHAGLGLPGSRTRSRSCQLLRRRAERSALARPASAARVAVLGQTAKPIKIGGRDGNGNPSAHAADSHAVSLLGIPARVQTSDAIHYQAVEEVSGQRNWE